MGGDHLDAELGELGIEWVTVVGFVADQARRQLLYESSSEGVDNEFLLISLTTCNPDGERKAIAVCHCHDLGRLAASSDPNKSAPLFAPAWEPSMNASVRSPRSLRSSASFRSTR